MTASTEFQLIEGPALASMATAFRQKLLEALAEPDSAAGLARRMDMSRQRLGYHMRELEKAGCIEQVGERQRRGLKERLYQVRPLAWVCAPRTLAAGRLDDRYAWATLVSRLGRALWDLVRLREKADAAGKRLATLCLEGELRVASPAARRAFSEDLVRSVQEVIARHHDAAAPEGRSFQVLLGAYPVPAEPGRERPASVNERETSNE